MIDDIKKELKRNPDNLIEFLSKFGYCNIVNHGDKYLSFGRDANSSKKSIVINLRNNDWLYVTDYAKAVNADIISYIMTQRGVLFVDVLNQIKSVLGITSFSETFNRKKIFGGFYDSIKSKNKDAIVATYDDSLLDQFENCGNRRFQRDHISLSTQKFFDIRYDLDSQGIVIPIRNEASELMGIKVRCNYEVADGEQKYWYLVPCRMSQTLYGYSQNYNYLVGNDIYVFESEKSTMQCFTYGIRNCVSLGSGTVSLKQTKLLYELQPTRIILMHDVGYAEESIMRNVDMISKYIRFSEIPVGYWDWKSHGYTGKDSPSDFGKDKLLQIIDKEIKEV